MINKFTIYGERCSGTNYLEELIGLNFNVQLTWNYGWKHFFGFDDLSNSDDTLFICIVRDLHDWLNSFYREKHHLPLLFLEISDDEKKDMFLNKEIYSIGYKNKTELPDRNIYTNERYKNIFELRHTKNKFLIEDLDKKVKNYILIRYEDLLNNFDETMNKIKDKGLELKNPSNFPLNTSNYRKNKNIKYEEVKKKQGPYLISKDEVFTNPNLIKDYEIKLGYME
jgi:hypothetical protein